MTLDRPEILWGLAALAAVALLHLLRARRRRVEEPSLALWRAVAPAAAGAAARRRRVPPLDLLASLAFVLFAVLSAAGPSLPRTGVGGRALLFLVDRTASMAAPAGAGQSRFDEALKAVRAEGAALAAADRITLRAFPPAPDGDRTVAPRDLEKALASLPGPTGRAVPPLKALAGAASAFHGVVLFTDGALDLQGLARSDLRIRVVSSSVPNVGIVAFDVAAGPGGRWQVFAEIAAHGGAGGEVPLVLSDAVTGRVLARSAVTVSGRSRARTVLEVLESDLKAAPVLSLRLEGGDAFPADDRVFAVAGTVRPLRVSVRGADASFLVKALRAVPGHEVTVAGSDTDDDADLAVYHRALPGRSLSTPSLLVDPADGGPHFSLSPRRTRAEGDVLEAAPWTGPRLSRLCQSLSAFEYRVLSAAGGTPLRPVLSLGNGPVAALVPAGRGRSRSLVVCLPVFGPGAPWVWEPSFPLFWTEMTRLALGPGADAEPRSLRFAWNRTGDLVSLPRSGSVPAPARRLVSPGGSVLPLARERRSLLLEEAGLYRLEDGDGPVYVAANLLAAGESDLSVRPDAAHTAPLPPPPGPAPGRLPLQSGLAVLALLSLLASVLLFLRRERGWTRVLPLLLLCLAAGCPEGDSARGGKKELAPGRQVEVAQPEAKKQGVRCPSCGALAGEGHRCGLSRFCPDCGVERSLAFHVCGVSRFCPKCGRERSLLEHRCGETAFCPVCLAEVVLPHEHLEEKEEEK